MHVEELINGTVRIQRTLLQDERERERERERDRQTDRQTDRQREMDRKKEIVPITIARKKFSATTDTNGNP